MSSTQWEGDTSRRELLGIVFSLSSWGLGPARLTLEASGLCWRWWYHDIINTETKPPPTLCPPWFDYFTSWLTSHSPIFLIEKIFNPLAFFFQWNKIHSGCLDNTILNISLELCFCNKRAPSQLNCYLFCMVSVTFFVFCTGGCSRNTDGSHNRHSAPNSIMAIIWRRPGVQKWKEGCLAVQYSWRPFGQRVLCLDDKLQIICFPMIHIHFPGQAFRFSESLGKQPVFVRKCHPTSDSKGFSTSSSVQNYKPCVIWRSHFVAALVGL